MSADNWRKRPMTVTVLDHCDECKTLKPDVAERASYWPSFRLKSCSNCFNERVAEYNDLSCT